MSFKMCRIITERVLLSASIGSKHTQAHATKHARNARKHACTDGRMHARTRARTHQRPSVAEAEGADKVGPRAVDFLEADLDHLADRRLLRRHAPPQVQGREKQTTLVQKLLDLKGGRKKKTKQKCVFVRERRRTIGRHPSLDFENPAYVAATAATDGRTRTQKTKANTTSATERRVQ